MVPNQKRPTVKRAPRPTASKQTRPAAGAARHVDGDPPDRLVEISQVFGLPRAQLAARDPATIERLALELRAMADDLVTRIPRESPALQPALVQEIGRAWAAWENAAELAPQIEEAPVVALVLRALGEALRLGDQTALGLLHAGARAALDQVAPAIAAETHARYAADGTLTPGVTVADLMPKKLQRKGAGRRGDRVPAAEGLAECMERYLTRSSRRSAGSGAPLPPMSPEEMARGFVLAAAPDAGPIGRELKKRELLPVHESESYDPHGDPTRTKLLPGSILDVKIKAVTAAFRRHLQEAPRSTSPQRWWLRKGESWDTASTGKDLVRVGLRALGLPAGYVKNLFGRAS